MKLFFNGGILQTAQKKNRGVPESMASIPPVGFHYGLTIGIMSRGGEAQVVYTVEVEIS